MMNSSQFCRTQEARQRAIAAGAGLANVRKVALAAAAAWALEAELAEAQETRGVGDLSAEDAAIAEEFRLEGDVADEDAAEDVAV